MTGIVAEHAEVVVAAAADSRREVVVVVVVATHTEGWWCVLLQQIDVMGRLVGTDGSSTGVGSVLAPSQTMARSVVKEANKAATVEVVVVVAAAHRQRTAADMSLGWVLAVAVAEERRYRTAVNKRCVEC